jgi:hypothetical protein
MPDTTLPSYLKSLTQDLIKDDIQEGLRKNCGEYDPKETIPELLLCVAPYEN